MQSEFKKMLADFKIFDAINCMQACEKYDSMKIQSHNDIIAAVAFRLIQNFLVQLVLWNEQEKKK